MQYIYIYMYIYIHTASLTHAWLGITNLYKDVITILFICNIRY